MEESKNSSDPAEEEGKYCEILDQISRSIFPFPGGGIEERRRDLEEEMMFIRTKVDWRLSLLLLAAMGRIGASVKGDVRGKRQALYPPPLVYPLGGVLKVFIPYLDVVGSDKT